MGSKVKSARHVCGSEGMVGHLRQFPAWPMIDWETDRSLLNRLPIFDLTAVRVRRTATNVHFIVKLDGVGYECKVFEP